MPILATPIPKKYESETSQDRDRVAFGTNKIVGSNVPAPKVMMGLGIQEVLVGLEEVMQD